MSIWTERGILVGILSLAIVGVGPFSAFASDLDDGIAIDEPIDDSVETEANILFIVNHSKAKARQSGDGVVTDGGVGNISIGVGADLRGATIVNLSDNEGAAAVSE